MFFSILKFWFSGLSEGWKGKKGPKWQKSLPVSLHTSGTVHIIWSWFLVHMCKMMISPAIFFIFQNFDFGLSGGWKGKKKAQNDKKILPVSLRTSGTVHIIWLWFLLHMCKMMISPTIFFIFQNFDFCVFMGLKGQIMT